MKSKIGLIRVLVAIVVIGFVLTACSDAGDDASTRSIVYGLTLEPSGIDPHINQSSELGLILRQVYDTLVYRDPDTREIVPGLAESWETSEDGLVYTFHLRQDVTFHDGTAFNAAAVAANLDRIIDPETASQKALFLLGPYESYSLTDAYTIQLTLTSPFAPLLDGLAQVYLGIASPNALAEYSLNRYQFHQVGTGPFEFVEMVPGDRVVLRRYDDYAWGPNFYAAPGENAVEEIVYRFFTDPATRLTALEAGEAAVMGEILPADARTLTGNSSVRMMPVEIPGLPVQFLMNTTLYPTDSLPVRQALITATNRRMIADTIYQRFASPAWGPLTAVTEYYNSELVGMYDFNTTQAVDILGSAGFRDSDSDGLLDAGGEPLEVIILYPPWSLLPQTVQLIQEQWRDAGITAVLRPVPTFSALREAVAEGDYNLVAFDASGYDPSLLNTFYLSDGANNYTNYQNPELDSALLAGVQATNPGTRRSIYLQIQQFIMQQALVLPIRDRVNLNGTLSELDGLRFDPYGWFPLMHDVTLSES